MRLTSETYEHPCVAGDKPLKRPALRVLLAAAKLTGQ